MNLWLTNRQKVKDDETFVSKDFYRGSKKEASLRCKEGLGRNFGVRLSAIVNENKTDTVRAQNISP